MHARRPCARPRSARSSRPRRPRRRCPRRWPGRRSRLDAVLGLAACRLSTRTSRPASRRRGTTRRPSVPVPPVTRIVRPCHAACSSVVRRSHRRVRAGLAPDDRPRREECDRCTTRLAGRAIRGAPRPADGASPTGCSARPSEADDAVQEAWIRLSRSDADAVENLGALADDGRLARVPEHAAGAPRRGREVAARTARARPSRPPSADPEHEALLADSVGLALLVVLDTLSPGRAGRVRPARHVRRAVRRDRADPRPQRRRRPASSPAARAAACGARTRAPRPTGCASAELVDAFLAAARDGDFERAARAARPRRRAARRRDRRRRWARRREIRGAPSGRRVRPPRPRRHPRAARRRAGGGLARRAASRASSTASPTQRRPDHRRST